MFREIWCYLYFNFFLNVKYLGGSFFMINERNMKVIFYLI